MQTTPESGNYIGPGSCGATACHGAIRPVAGERILQTEYTTWIAQERRTRAMAAETLTAALTKNRGQDSMAAKPAFNELFKEFESPSSYDPRRFAAAMKKVESATGR